MNYLDKCLVKTDLYMNKLKASPSLIVFILAGDKDRYNAYTLSDFKKIMDNPQNHYIENENKLEKFFHLPNRIVIDSSFESCFKNKVNTMHLVFNENKFRIGFDSGKQLFSYYSVTQGCRNDIHSGESSFFEDGVENESSEMDSDSEVELDWEEIKKLQEERKKIENKRLENEQKNGNYNISRNSVRDDQPAVIHYYENGNIENEEWYRDGMLHRENNR